MRQSRNIVRFDAAIGSERLIAATRSSDNVDVEVVY
jgi:hypothetical protein